MNEKLYREAERSLWQSKGVTPTERLVHLARDNASVRIQEVGNGPAVLFVHGGINGGSSWAALAAQLHGYRCILVDRPGCGLSGPHPPKLGGQDLRQFGESLVIDVLDALGLESAHLVATSFGGYAGLHAAAANPGRIGRMIQFSWPVGASDASLPAFMRMMGVPGIGRLAGVVPPNERTVRMIFRTIGHGPSVAAGRITAADLAWYLALLRHTDTMRNEFKWGRSLISPRGRLRESVRFSNSFLASISTPTMFLWGENDPFGGAETARKLVARIPGAALQLVTGAGHAPWLDDIDLCAEATARFLAG